MQVTEPVEVLYVSTADDEPAPVELAEDGLSISVVTPEGADESDLQSATCVLLSDALGRDAIRPFVRQLRTDHPSLPVVAFTGGDDPESLFDAGVTDVVHSTATETPASVVRRRLETALRGHADGGGALEELGRRLEDGDDALFREITESISDVVWVNVPGEEGLEYVNSAYSEVWGRPRERLYESREALIETVHPEDRERVRDAMARQRERPEACDVTYRVVRPDGEIRWVNSRAFGLRENGELERVVGVATDVTEQKEREQQLENQRDELAELNHINRIIRGVDEALLGAETREEVLQAVCDRLAAADRYRFAVALRVGGGDRLEAAAWTDGAGEVVEEFFPVVRDSPGGSPGRRALATGQTQVVPEVDTSELLREEWAETLQDAGVRSLAAVPLVYGASEYGVIAVYSEERDVFGERERAVLDELGGTVGYAVSAVESRERERTLTALYRATEDLLTADTPQAVGEVVVETAADVLDLSGIGIFLFDDDTNLLSLAAGTERFHEFFGESRVFGPGKEDSITWQTYVTGETQRFTDVRESEQLANPDTSTRGSLLIPLGEHGVFVAASTEVGVFDEQKRPLVGLLAATTEAALDRVAGQAGIRERDAELEARDERLARYEQLLSLVRTLTRLLRRAETRDEIEEQLCEQLVERECLSFAWVGHTPPGEDTLEPRTWAGAEDGYLDAVFPVLDSDEPTVRAARAGEPVSVQNVSTHLHEQAWAREAISREYQSVLAVPLVDGETCYGVLSVYASEPGIFDEVIDGMAAELGATAAYGINSVETRRGILAEQATELDLHIADTGTALNAIAEIAGEAVTYQEVTPVSDQSTRILFALSDPPVEDVLAVKSEFVAVESLTHTRRRETHLFRVTLSGPTVATAVLDCGGIPRQVTAHPGGTRATVRLPREFAVREFLDRLRERYPGTELRSRQDVDRLETTVDDARLALEEHLTDRQREVLVTAYRSGFFTSPRETTGEELAALLDLSQPTVTHHLREAQRRLLATLLDPE